MSYHKKERMAALIVRHIMDIIQSQLKNPNLGFVSINGSKISKDNSHVKLYVTFLGQGERDKQLEELQKSKGFIRSELAKRLSIYKVPELDFVYDDSFDKVAKLEQALNK